jgi:hypothetical protein
MPGKFTWVGEEEEGRQSSVPRVLLVSNFLSQLGSWDKHKQWSIMYMLYTFNNEGWWVKTSGVLDAGPGRRGREIKKHIWWSNMVHYTNKMMYLPKTMPVVSIQRNNSWKFSRILLKILIQEAKGIWDYANEMKFTPTF